MANIMERIIKKSDFGDTSKTGQSTVTDKSIIDAINRCSREIQGLNSQVSQLHSVNNQEDVLAHIKILEDQLSKIQVELGKKELGSKGEGNQLKEFVTIYEKKEEETKNFLFEHIHKEAVKNYRNVQGVLEENVKTELKSLKSIKRYLRGILWILLLITALIICNIIGVI